MRRARETAGEFVPNLAPMVDVIMVLLVFFLLGTSLEFVRQGVLETQLDPASGPGGGTAVRLLPLVRITLRDVADGQSVRLFVVDEPLAENDFEQLQRFLAQRRAAGADPTNPIVIQAEHTVRWQFVVAAMDAAVRAGFKNVQFAVSLE